MINHTNKEEEIIMKSMVSESGVAFKHSNGVTFSVQCHDRGVSYSYKEGDGIKVFVLTPEGVIEVEESLTKD